MLSSSKALVWLRYVSRVDVDPGADFSCLAIPAVLSTLGEVSSSGLVEVSKQAGGSDGSFSLQKRKQTICHAQVLQQIFKLYNVYMATLVYVHASVCGLAWGGRSCLRIR